MKLAWAIVAGLALGIVAWWLAGREPEPDRTAPRHGEATAAEDGQSPAPGLYRWRDSAGVLHVTQEPPKGRRYERIDAQPRDGIEVHGDRR